MAGCGGEVGVNWLEGGARVQVRGQHIQNPPWKSREPGGTGRVGGTAEGFEAEHRFAVMGAREALKVGEQRRHSGVGVSEDTGS